MLEARAAELGVEVTHSSQTEIGSIALDARGSDFTWRGLRMRCPLPGEHQIDNVRTAIAALDRLDVPLQAIRQGIAETVWPGRLDRIAENPEIILDGAHNPAGARALAAYLDRFYDPRRVWLIYGAMRDKAVEEVTAVLFPRATHVIVTAPAQTRALRPESILELVDHPDIRAVPDLPTALDLARTQSAPNEAIFVTGSLFLVGQALSLRRPRRPPAS